MKNNFQENLKKLTKEHSQKYIADKTGFSQSSINNYLTKNSEPSIQFLIALKDAFGICVDDFLFSDFEVNEKASYDRFIGNYIIYYYNNDSYKGEVHSDLKNTLNYGVISIFKERELDTNVVVYATFVKDRVSAIKMLKTCKANKSNKDLTKLFKQTNNFYKGEIGINQQSIFIELKNKFNNDQCYIVLNNPPTNTDYVGGVGTVNSVARGREHNPCVQYLIMSKKLLDVPDDEIYNCLKFDDFNVDLEEETADIVEMFKRLYALNNEISVDLSENQKQALIQNKIEYYFNEILEANAFRFAKVSNREDDAIYKLIREGIDV